MSKDFEQAYRELAQKEAPDLWDRIEAGITSRSTPEHVESGQDIVLCSEGIEPDKEAGSKQDEKWKVGRNEKQGARESKRILEKLRIFSKKYSGLAAAVLCVAVLLPVAVLIGQSGNKSSSGGAMIKEMALDEAAPEMAEGAAENMAAAFPADTAEAETDEFATNMTEVETEGFAADMSEAETTESAADAAEEELDGGKKIKIVDSLSGGTQREQDGTGALEEGGFAPEVAAASEEVSADRGAEAEKMASAQGAAENNIRDDVSEIREESVDTFAKSDAVSELSDGAVLKNVIIKVTDVSEGIKEEEESGLFGSVYKAVIRGDASDNLKEGSEIDIFVPIDSSLILLQDHVFQADLLYKSDSKYPFVLTGNVVQIGEERTE